MSPQPVDDLVTGTTDDKVTEIGAPVRTRRIQRRSAPSLTDPRRAPDGFAEPSPGSSDNAVPAEAAIPDPPARHSAATGVAVGVAIIREALRSMPAKQWQCCARVPAGTA